MCATCTAYTGLHLFCELDPSPILPSYIPVVFVLGLHVSWILDTDYPVSHVFTRINHALLFRSQYRTCNATDVATVIYDSHVT